MNLHLLYYLHVNQGEGLYVATSVSHEGIQDQELALRFCQMYASVIELIGQKCTKRKDPLEWSLANPKEEEVSTSPFEIVDPKSIHLNGIVLDDDFMWEIESYRSGKRNTPPSALVCGEQKKAIAYALEHAAYMHPESILLGRRAVLDMWGKTKGSEEMLEQQKNSIGIIEVTGTEIWPLSQMRSCMPTIAVAPCFFETLTRGKEDLCLIDLYTYAEEKSVKNIVRGVKKLYNVEYDPSQVTKLFVEQHPTVYTQLKTLLERLAEKKRAKARTPSGKKRKIEISEEELKQYFEKVYHTLIIKSS